MEQMNVYEMTTRLQRLYPRIEHSTKVAWFKSIKPIQELQLEHVDDDVAYNYLDQGMQQWSESYTKRNIGYLKGLWNKARKKKLYKGENPWLDLDDGLQVNTRNPELHPWEFYSYYHEDPYFVCLWYSGMRIGELAGIYPEHIHVDAKIPYFDLIHQKNRRLKNDESVRQVPIHPACMPYVERLYLSKAKSPGQSWSENFRRNLGLPKGDGAHSLRHSFTSRMVKAGIIDRVQDQLLGHSSKSMTSRYGKVELDTLYTAIQKIT